MQSLAKSKQHLAFFIFFSSCKRQQTCSRQVLGLALMTRAHKQSPWLLKVSKESLEKNLG